MNAGPGERDTGTAKQRKDIWLSKVEKGPSDYYLYAQDRQDSHGMDSTGRLMAFTGLIGIIFDLVPPSLPLPPSDAFFLLGPPAARDAEVKLFAPSSPGQPASCNSQLSNEVPARRQQLFLVADEFFLFLLLPSLLLTFFPLLFASREAKVKLLHAHSRCHVTRQPSQSLKLKRNRAVDQITS